MILDINKKNTKPVLNYEEYVEERRRVIYLSKKVIAEQEKEKRKQNCKRHKQCTSKTSGGMGF